MIPTRKLAAMFLCVFLLGAVAGALLAYNFTGTELSGFLRRTGDPAALAAHVDKKLASKYGLDADEQARIAPLTREMARNLYQVRRKFAEDILTTLDASHEKIGAQMTASQREAYAKDMADRRTRASTMLMPATNLAFPAQQ